ncbi:uncharacterized protein APUU_22172S [Aspergillus puulaauensis]|uniref:Uncharacterized protein n=1 Tax=Aspergillus puulaauensis TaxID=1220207 RepID=A0A7R7XHX2_9EURO|nr:uncharacterized protein APUU_22172S [Aspergillus puulaauensis]BCS21740.1 hypothetical protein APUU_22172S [Aspergillus puulaauensis]
MTRLSSEAADYAPLALSNATTSDHDEPPDEWQIPRSKAANVWARIGTLNLLVLALGSIFLAAPLVLLGLVWRESVVAISGGHPNMLWTRVVHAEWTARFVTACTAVIRIIIAFQAGVFTAMVASIMLETIGTPLSYAPFYSIIRAVSVSPNTLLFTASLRPKGVLSLLIALLVVVEAAVIVASQFLSTILISDFMNSRFTDADNFTQVGGAIDYYGRVSFWWKMPPTSSWTFAEMSEPFSDGPNYHDTGHTYRAFLPFDDEAPRKDLRRFRGPAQVIDYRVFCVQPFLHDMTLNPLGADGLSGQVAIDAPYHQLPGLPTNQFVNFTCKLPSPYIRERMWGEGSLCFPQLPENWTVQLAEPLVETIENRWPSFANMFLVLDSLDHGARISNYQGLAIPGPHVEVARKDGPWAIVNNGSDVEALRVSACFTDFHAAEFIVEMNSSWEGLEPKLTWDLEADGHNTEPSRRQLGVSRSPQSLRERGVLALIMHSQRNDSDLDTQDQGEDQGLVTPQQSVPGFLSGLPPENKYDEANFDTGLLLSKGDVSDVLRADVSHVDLFQDALHDTDSPALASQGLLTRAAQMAYYKDLVRDNTTESARTAFSTIASIPMQWTGFIVAVSLVAAHVTILLIILVIFIFSTHHSLLGHYWQAIAQVVSEDTIRVLEQADAMKDDEVAQWGEHKIPQLAQTSLVRRQSSGRVAVGVGEESEI